MSYRQDPYTGKIRTYGPSGYPTDGEGPYYYNQEADEGGRTPRFGASLEGGADAAESILRGIIGLVCVVPLLIGYVWYVRWLLRTTSPAVAQVLSVRYQDYTFDSHGGLFALLFVCLVILVVFAEARQPLLRAGSRVVALLMALVIFPLALTTLNVYGYQSSPAKKVVDGMASQATPAEWVKIANYRACYVTDEFWNILKKGGPEGLRVMGNFLDQHNEDLKRRAVRALESVGPEGKAILAQHLGVP